MSLCIGDAEGTAHWNGTGRLTNIYVEGETPGDVKMVVDRLRKELGVVDLTPWLPTFFYLPSLDNFFQRVKFLFWDYLVKGKVVEGSPMVKASLAERETVES